MSRGHTWTSSPGTRVDGPAAPRVRRRRRSAPSSPPSPSASACRLDRRWSPARFCRPGPCAERGHPRRIVQVAARRAREVTTRMNQTAAASKGMTQRLLDLVERVGNRVPHPVLIFLALIVVVVVVSHVLYLAHISVSHEVIVPE